MGSFVKKIFSNLSSLVLNLIVIVLSAVSVLGLVFFPTLNINTDVALSKDVAKILFPEQENPTEEDELLQLVVKELVKQQVVLHCKITLTFENVMDCALDATSQKTKETLCLCTDKIAESVDDKITNKIKIAIVSAGVTTAIKTQIEIISDSLSEISDEVMQNIGVDDDYVANKTNDVLDSIRADGATVDSVTDTIMSIVEDVDKKLQNSDYKDEVEALTQENKEEIRVAVEELINALADENGNIDEDSLIEALLGELGLSESVAYGSMQSKNATSYLVKPPRLLENAESSQPNSVEEMLKEKLRELITYEVAVVARYVFLAILALLALVAIAWAYLILKIMLKLQAKNPLIKLKAPISVSWIPFAILVALPCLAVGLLKNPPQMIINAIGVEGVKTISPIASAINLTVSSSFTIPFVASAILLVFGIFYSARRKAINKGLKNN